MSLVLNAHDAGFFSTSTIILFEIINYYKKNDCYPKIINSSKVFTWYKKNKNCDIFSDFFKIQNLKNFDIKMFTNFNYDSRGDLQFEKYIDHNLDIYFEFVNIYFNLWKLNK